MVINVLTVNTILDWRFLINKPICLQGKVRYPALLCGGHNLIAINSSFGRFLGGVS